MNVINAIQSAFAHHKNGRFDQAEQIYNKILKKHPDNFDAIHMLGVLYFQRGKLGHAKQCIERAVALNRSNAIAHFNLGNVLFQMGGLDDAILSYQEVIKLNPQFYEAHFNIGNAYREKGEYDSAIHFYQSTAQLNPHHVDAHYNLGNILIIKKKLNEGIESYNRSISINPNHPDALLNRGFAFQMQGKMEKALEDYRLVLKINPTSLEAYSNLGNLLKDLGLPLEAETCFRRALEINPSFWIPYSNLLFLMHYTSRFSPESIFTEHLQFAKQFEKPLESASLSYSKGQAPERRLRIGYVSPDLRKHSVAYFLEPVLAAHDKKQFEVFCYSIVPAEDDVTARLRSHADRWLNISEISDDLAAEAIRKDSVDILVDLAGHTANNRILLFARKPAPVQVTWIGYPATTGLSAMDYKIVDHYTDPPGLTEQFYTEKLIRLPGCYLCYLPDRESPDISPLPALSSGHVIFGSFNNFAKVTPEVIELWARILKTVPDSRLILKSKSLSSSSVRDFVTGMFVEKGISSDRIELYGWEASAHSHLALYNRIDIALDTFPYNGTTTTCEALWMGVPVVTLAGTTHVSRVGISLLSNLGISELAASSSDEYVSIAVALAADRKKLQSLREKLRDMMMGSPLMNAGFFVANLENYYRMIWRIWCDSP